MDELISVRQVYKTLSVQALILIGRNCLWNHKTQLQRKHPDTVFPNLWVGPQKCFTEPLKVGCGPALTLMAASIAVF